MKAAIQGILSVAVLMSLIGYGFYLGLMIPDVHVSNSTNECVEVINYHENDSYTCENLPSKYNKVWVK